MATGTDVSLPKTCTLASASNATAAAAVTRGWELFEKIGKPKFICAPMVDQSELPFRLLTKRYGTTLTYTPMLHARIYGESEKYRQMNFRTCEAERPVFVQFCGDDPDVLLRAAKLVESRCDAVDINLGCPQGIARKGHYGSFLLEEIDLLERIVSKLATELSIPVTCKIRLRSTGETSVEDTITLCKRLEAAGCCLLTVHGRTKECKQQFTGAVDWDAIRSIKKAMEIPVFANGGIASYTDVIKCMEATGVDGVMSSEALLENPSLFTEPSNGWKPLISLEDLCQNAVGTDLISFHENCAKRKRKLKKSAKRKRRKAIKNGQDTDITDKNDHMNKNDQLESLNEEKKEIVYDAATCIKRAKAMDVQFLENSSISCDIPQSAASSDIRLARQFQLAKEYMILAHAYPPRTLKIVKKHIMQFLFGAFMAHPEQRGFLFSSRSMSNIDEIIMTLENVAIKSILENKENATALHMAGDVGAAGKWYDRHRERDEKRKLEANNKKDTSSGKVVASSGSTNM